MKDTTTDVAWAAGLFEGEGTIYLARSTRRNERPRLALSLSSTDKDVVEKFRSIFGVGTLTGPYMQKKSTKPCWLWRVRKEEDCDSMIEALYPYLGTRRRMTIDSLLAEKEESDRRWRPRRRGRRPGPQVARDQLGLLG